MVLLLATSATCADYLMSPSSVRWDAAAAAGGESGSSQELLSDGEPGVAVVEAAGSGGGGGSGSGSGMPFINVISPSY